MQNRKDLFEKKLRESLCNRVLTKDIHFTSNRVHINVVIRDLVHTGDKYLMGGIRVAGYIDFGGDPKTRKELCDIEYKQMLDKDGMVTYFLYNSLWMVLLSKLKHFGLDKIDVAIKDDINYLKMRRFFRHTKRYAAKRISDATDIDNRQDQA